MVVQDFIAENRNSFLYITLNIVKSFNMCRSWVYNFFCLSKPFGTSDTNGNMKLQEVNSDPDLVKLFWVQKTKDLNFYNSASLLFRPSLCWMS